MNVYMIASSTGVVHAQLEVGITLNKFVFVHSSQTDVIERRNIFSCILSKSPKMELTACSHKLLHGKQAVLDRYLGYL